MESVDVSDSSYVAYLPPVLWRSDPFDDAPPGRIRLGPLLRIYEKLLTGIDDGVEIRHLDHEHRPIAAQVSDLHRVFDPWGTPEPMVRWLAARLGLAFPSMQGSELWDEYQRRRATALIARIYRQRGLKTGLARYLDLYSSAQVSPRVAIDDGVRLARVRPGQPMGTRVAGLVARGPVLAADRSLLAEGLARPQCVARGPDGSLFAADSPLPVETPIPDFRPRLWRFTATGDYRHSSGATAPLPIAASTLPVQDVCALAVGPARPDRPETAYVLERSGLLFAVPAPYESAAAVQIGDLRETGKPFVPAAMVLDPANGTLIVLDKGAGPATPNPPQVLVVNPSPFSITRTRLTILVEPLSLLVEADGSLLIGDAGEQEPVGRHDLPGNLIRVDRASSPWREQALLDMPEEDHPLPTDNPLRAPTGLVRTADGQLYVLDAGLKPFAPSAADPFISAAADPAVVFRVRESDDEVSLARITEPGAFVFPVGMAAAGSDLIVVDKGQVDPQSPSWSRLQPFEFDVVIHFPADRVSQVEDRDRTLSRVVGDITTVVNSQKPAHTVWNLVTRF